jgi:hypothetical protein
MKERKKDRRSYIRVPDFPLLTPKGLVQNERRRHVDRRLRNLEFGWFQA